MSEHMSELEDFLSETTQPVVVHAMAATAPVCGEGEKGDAAAMLENFAFCTNFCPWLDEEWTAALDASTALDEPSSVYVEKKNGSHMETISFCSDFCLWLDEDWTVPSDAGTVPDEISPDNTAEKNTTGSHMETISFCNDFCPWLDEDWTVASDTGTVSDEMSDEISPPENTAEKNTTEIHTGGSRRSRIHAFFKRVWKAIKKPFLCCRRRRVEPQTPQGNPHTTDPDLETDSDPEPVPGLSGLQSTVEPNSDPEPMPGPSRCQITVDPVPDPEPVPGLSGCQNTVDPNPDPEPVPGLSGLQNTVDLNPDPEPVPGPSGRQITVDLVPDPEPVPRPSGCQNTVDPNPDPKPVPGPSGCQFTVHPVPDPEPFPRASGCQNTVDPNPDPEPVPGLSGLQNTVDPVPDPEPVPRPSGCQNTVDTNPDAKPVPGPSGRQFTVHPVPDPEPVPRASGCQNTVYLNPEPVPGPSGRQFTLDPVPDPEPVPRASGCQNTVDLVPDPEHVLRHCRSQITFDPGPDPEPVPGPSGLQDMADGESSSATGPNRGLLNSLYSFGDILGSGSFGVTHKAIRKSDGKEVAIKRIRKRLGDRYISVPGYSKPIFKEAAFMLMLKNPPTSIYLIEMYEWFDQEGCISLIMEYPKPCISLGTFVYRHGKLIEPITRGLLHQLILAVQHSLEHGICHNDVHPDNILVNTETLKLKLIDFGCATMYKEEEHEMVISGSIWILGYLLYFMVNGKVPLYSRDKKGYWLTFIPNLSSECCDLIEKCLNQDLLTLEEVLEHEWMKKL